MEAPFSNAGEIAALLERNARDGVDARRDLEDRLVVAAREFVGNEQPIDLTHVQPLAGSEWTQVLPNPRQCKAVLDRVTDRAHIIETGTESHWFKRTMNRKEARKR